MLYPFSLMTPPRCCRAFAGCIKPEASTDVSSTSKTALWLFPESLLYRLCARKNISSKIMKQ